MSRFITACGRFTYMDLALPCCGWEQGFRFKRDEPTVIERTCPKCDAQWRVEAFRQTSWPADQGDRFVLDWHRLSETPEGIVARPITTVH